MLSFYDLCINDFHQNYFWKSWKFQQKSSKSVYFAEKSWIFTWNRPFIDKVLTSVGQGLLSCNFRIT